MSEKIVNIKYINSENEEIDEIILFNKDYKMFLNSCFEKFMIENEKLFFLFFIYNNVKYKINNQEEYSKIVDNVNDVIINFVITKNEIEEIGKIDDLIEKIENNEISNNNENNNISNINNISNNNNINENNNNINISNNNNNINNNNENNNKNENNTNNEININNENNTIENNNNEINNNNENNTNNEINNNNENNNNENNTNNEKNTNENNNNENNNNENTNNSNINTNNENNNNNKNYDSYLYVMNLSRIFEGKVVTENLNCWIDLIFGETQKAKEPDKIKNLFRPESYIDNPENTDKKILKNREDEEFLLNSIEFGLIPLQTLLKTNEKKFSNKINNFYLYEQDFSTVQMTFLNLILYGKKFKNEKEENFYKKYFNIKITCFEFIKYYKTYFICGNLIGDIHIFETDNENFSLENYNFFKHITTKHDSNSRINCIKYNYNLNLIISGSKEGIINIYTNINFKLIHCVNIFKEINFCCLVSNPIPSVVYYSENYNVLASFPINNNNEYKFNEINNLKIFYPLLYKDSSDEDILICVDESKKNIVIYSLPELNKFKKSYKCEFEINKFGFIDNEKKYIVVEKIIIMKLFCLI